jgi:hypothetical protein
VKKIVTELNQFDNLYYEICNEAYFGGVTLDWQHHIAETIAATEKNLPKKHLISRNVANGSAKVDRPHEAISIYNFHYAAPPNTVPLNYSLNKPLGDNETGFRGTNDLPYRVEAWAFLLSGGALYNNLDYSFVAGQEDGTYVYPASQPGGGNPAFRKQLKALRDFMNGFDFIRMSPDNELIRSGLPEGMLAYGLSKPGTDYAAYFAPRLKDKNPSPADFTEDRSFTLKLMLPKGEYRVQWLDPVTGKKSPETALVVHEAVPEVTSPPHREDMALSIRRK